MLPQRWFPKILQCQGLPATAVVCGGVIARFRRPGVNDGYDRLAALQLRRTICTLGHDQADNASVSEKI